MSGFNVSPNVTVWWLTLTMSGTSHIVAVSISSNYPFNNSSRIYWHWDYFDIPWVYRKFCLNWDNRFLLALDFFHTFSVLNEFHIWKRLNLGVSSSHHQVISRWLSALVTSGFIPSHQGPITYNQKVGLISCFRGCDYEFFGRNQQNWIVLPKNMQALGSNMIKLSHKITNKEYNCWQLKGPICQHS